MEIQLLKVGVDNCYIIRDENTILVDGGMPGRLEEFSSGLKNIGMNPNEIEALVITHCHWDHIGCARQIKDMSRASVIVHKCEKGILENGELSMPPGVTRWGKLFGAFLRGWSKRFSIQPCETDIVMEEDDFSLEGFGIRGSIVFTPGHSSGSISVVLDSGQAFVGDMAMNGLPLTIGANLPIFAEDMPALKNSWRKLINRGVKTVYPAHGNPFPVETLVRTCAKTRWNFN